MKTEKHGRHLGSRVLLCAMFCMMATASPGWTHEFPSVTNLSDLVALVNQPWTNSMCIMPPGNVRYQTELGLYTYQDGFTPGFLTNLLPATNSGVEMFPFTVIETNTSPRQRLYLNSAGVAVYTTTVSLTGYPSNIIMASYGAVPSYLDATNRTQWFAERDPDRQRIVATLISQSNTEAYYATMTNALTVMLDETNSICLLDLYSNDVAFVKVSAKGCGSFEYYLHAPTNIPKLDLFVSTNLLDPMGGWSLPGSLNHASDPLCGAYQGTNPSAYFAAADPAVDSDGDGLADCLESRIYGTDPTLRDTDGDGLADGEEVLRWGSDPAQAFSDGSGMTDGEKVALGLSPSWVDTDHDGASDCSEVNTYFTNPLNPDGDGDGLQDGAEIAAHTYAGCADTDGDGLTDKQEIDLGTNPLLADTDGDGIDDKYEHDIGWNPDNSSNAGQDDDNDGLTNLQEYQWFYSPKNSNTHDYVQRLIVVPPGINGIRAQADTSHFKMLVPGDWAHPARLWIRPLRSGTNLVEQLLYHTQTSGFYINGVEASSMASPITIPPSTTNTEFKITSSPSAWGTNITFSLTNTYGLDHVNYKAIAYSPKITRTSFFTSSSNCTNVDFGKTGTLFYCMSGPSNKPSLFLYPYQSPDAGYGIPYFTFTDWCLVDVAGTGCSYLTNTMNAYDWRSVYGYPGNSRKTTGMSFNPGEYCLTAGFDMSGDGILQDDEAQQTCKFLCVKADLALDSNNDGTIDTADDAMEEAAPGKIIYMDKDALIRDGTNDSDVVELKVNFDAGGAVVPNGCSVLLQWIDPGSTILSSVAIFLDAACTQLLEQTPNKQGHLFAAGDTVPGSVYIRATPYAMNGVMAPLDYTVVTQQVALVVSRTDTGKEFGRDTVRLTIVNRPAKTPTGNQFYIWEEEFALSGADQYNRQVLNALDEDLAGDSVHTNPYVAKWYRAAETNITPESYADLWKAAILLTSHHGNGGYVCPVAFSNNADGLAQAEAWASGLGTNWARTSRSDTYNCYFVKVDNSYFESHWKAQRDANNAILFAGSCEAAYSTTGMSSYIESAGGAFNCGCRSTTTANTAANVFLYTLNQMRISRWRTIYGAWQIGIEDNTLLQFAEVGAGKITLWPALLNGEEKACYPKGYSTNGVAMVLFDTELQSSLLPLVKISGDAHMTGSWPEWMNPAALRWPYTGDTSASVKTHLRIDAWQCVTPWTGVNFNGKWFSGDGMSCRKNLEWEF